MRIMGQGGGRQSFSGQQERSDPEAFRRGRRIGQIVRGRLLSPGPGGLFWVVIAGHKLLAALDHEPAPGRELVFRIERLEPELHLKDITPPPSVHTDPSLLLAALSETRTRFEHTLAEAKGFPAPPLDLTAARQTFNTVLAETPRACEAHARTLELFRLAAAFLPASRGRLLYAPWIFPGLTRSEILVSRIPRETGGPGFSLTIFGRLPACGLLLVQANLHGCDLVYRLQTERPEHNEALVAALAVVHFGNAAYKPLCRSAGRLADNQAKGLVAPLLAQAARPFTGLRLRV